VPDGATEENDGWYFPYQTETFLHAFHKKRCRRSARKHLSPDQLLKHREMYEHERP
jgi:hypothetical protein